MLQMTTQPGDIILDATAGAGTAGVSAINAGCGAILADRSPTAHKIIKERLGGYIEGVFADLIDAQVQSVLDCEHGGLNESFAELYARTLDAQRRS